MKAGFIKLVFNYSSIIRFSYIRVYKYPRVVFKGVFNLWLNIFDKLNLNLLIFLFYLLFKLSSWCNIPIKLYFLHKLLNYWI